ncbi:MAG: hypothetical protein AB2687_05690 [Candidatus Thiodiazotropha taylori]
MSKYKPGETSKAITNKKNAITNSINRKAELINSINSLDDIYTSLDMKKDLISEASVHRWSDDDLGIISYSWNTAHADHNAKALKKLHNSIKNANSKLADSDIHGSKSSKSTLANKATNKLREENEELKKSLAEVYRAYMQLVERYREDQVIDDAIRKLIQEQARILGNQRVWEVK